MSIEGEGGYSALEAAADQEIGAGSPATGGARGTDAVAVRLERLTRDFGAIRAVDDLSLEVPAGTVFGFLGPNGAGKTTTINILLGLLEPSAGRAEVLGYDTRAQGDDVRARTGALLEYNGLYEHLSAEDNLEFYGRVWRLAPEAREARIRELLDGLGFWDRRGEKVGTWSKGMQQKLAVARALLHRPNLVFLDEPTAGLDVMAANELRATLADLARREGVTVFLTTHNMAEAERLCSQVAVIRAGRLLAVGSPDALRAQAGGDRVEIRGSGFDTTLCERLEAEPDVLSAEVVNGHLLLQVSAGTDAAPLVRFLVEHGAAIEEVRRGQASLEEVFLTLMEEES